MVKLLLSQPDIKAGLQNVNNKTAYEAYADQYGYDEAATLIEKQTLHKHTHTDSIIIFTDFNSLQRALLTDKKTPEEQKVKIIENHILKYGQDMDYKHEIKARLQQSDELVERLRYIHSKTISDAYVYTQQENLKRDLNQKLMEVTGVNLIQGIKELSNK